MILNRRVRVWSTNNNRGNVEVCRQRSDQAVGGAVYGMVREMYRLLANETKVNKRVSDEPKKEERKSSINTNRAVSGWARRQTGNENHGCGEGRDIGVVTSEGE